METIKFNFGSQILEIIDQVNYDSLDDFLNEYSIVEIFDATKNFNSADELENFIGECVSQEIINQIDKLSNNLIWNKMPILLGLYLAFIKKIMTQYSDINYSELYDSINVKNYSIFEFSEAITLDKNIYISSKNYYYFPSNSEVTTSDIFDKLCHFVDDYVSPEDTLNILRAFGECDDLTTNKSVFISDITIGELDEMDLVSKIKLYLTVVKGDKIHKPVEMSTTTYPSYSIDYAKNDSLISSQFDDIIQLLSQFNNESRTIAKFLLLYQILESLEIRKDIVNQMNASHIFKIREFTKLANNTSKNERKYLKELFKDLFPTNYKEGTRSKEVRDIFIDKWRNLSISQSKWDNIRNELNLLANDSNKEISDSSLPSTYDDDKWFKLLSDSIYNIRCAVVHYKTNEYFLTDEKLHTLSELQYYLKEFIIPTTFKMIAVSIFATPNKVRYPSNSITLY
ncbi:hypothetical protein ACTGVN_09620 [Streptococcus suis]